jgi:head-tail adaptor
MAICIGDLREQIRFERETRTRDAYGNDVRAWETFATLRAKVQAVRATEQEERGAEAGVTHYVISLRNVHGLTTAMRAVWTTGGDVALNVREVRQPATRDDYLVLMAEKAVAI